MAYLLNLVDPTLLVILSPWIVLAAVRTGKYRQGYGEKLLGRVPRTSTRKCVWLHAVSVGEVNLIRTLVRQLAERWPEWECVVSTTTKTGYALARSRFPDLTVFYCPLDFSWAVRAAMRRVRPDLLVLAELELWPNLIRAARRQGAKVAIVNGRLSDKSYRGYRRLRWLTATMLGQIDLVAAQNQEYADRFAALGTNRQSVSVTGSLKFDGAETCRDNPATTMLKRLSGIGPDDQVFLAGSTQQPEESLALATFRELAQAHPRLRLVIVPRHSERFEAVASMLAAEGVPFQRRSELGRHAAGQGAPRVLLVDAVGELGAWWGAAHVAFVGGSLSQRGGQNMIEPAAYGAAVSFGPNTHNFRDVVAALLAARAAVVVRDGAELTEFVRRCLDEPHFADELGRNAQALVRTQLGATERTLDLLESLLPGPAHSKGARHAA